MTIIFIPVGAQGNGATLSNILYELGNPKTGNEITMYYSNWTHKDNIDWLAVDSEIEFYIQPNSNPSALLEFLAPYQAQGYITELELSNIEIFINTNKGSLVKLSDILPAFYIANSQPPEYFVEESLTI